MVCAQGGKGSDQITVMHSTIAPGALGQGEAQTHQQGLVLVQKLVGDLNFEKQRGGIKLAHGTRLLVFPCLLEIWTTAGTVQCDLALFAATLRADAPMHRRAKALFSSHLADGTAHKCRLPLVIMAF